METKFKISKPDYVNKTFRMPKELVENISVAANTAGVSVNEFMIQAAQFALDNLETDDKNAK